MTAPNINKFLKDRPRPCRYGAPMGAKSYLDNPEVPLYVQMVKMVDGDYAADGTYWGGPPSEPLWCGFSTDGDNRVYVRAKHRMEAVDVILKAYPEAQIWAPFGRILTASNLKERT